MGTAGSLLYYHSEINKNEPGSSVGPDGSVVYTFPTGRVSARYTSLTRNWSVGVTTRISRDVKYGIPAYCADTDNFLSKTIVYGIMGPLTIRVSKQSINQSINK